MLTVRGGTTPPNKWGVADCHGNVEEWVSDWYAGDYYSHSPAADPAGPASGVFKVSRGGSAKTALMHCF